MSVKGREWKNRRGKGKGEKTPLPRGIKYYSVELSKNCMSCVLGGVNKLCCRGVPVAKEGNGNWESGSGGRGKGGGFVRSEERAAVWEGDSSQ